MQCAIDIQWFVNQLGLSEDIVSSIVTKEQLDNLIYQSLSDELNNKQVELMAQLNQTKAFRVSTQDSNPVWEKGWGEVYDRLANDNTLVEDILKPQYFGKDDYVRLDGRYIKTVSEGFEYRMDLLIRKLVFIKYFSETERIVELGCGTGNSLLLLNQLYPNKSLVGADWATPSQKLLTKIAQVTGAKLSGVHFNMFTLEGKEQLAVSHHDGLLTVHALEQLGKDFTPLLTYIIERKPKICVHLEPIDEFYQPDKPFDKVALDYHQKRNYLDGYYQQLKQFEADGKIEIIEAKRLGFGGIYHEAYSLLVWKVL